MTRAVITLIPKTDEKKLLKTGDQFHSNVLTIKF